HGHHVGVRNGSAHHPRHEGDPRPVGRGRVGARAGRQRARRWSRGLPQAAAGAVVSVAARLAELGLRLPEVATPVAAYVPAVRSGKYVYTSGQLPIVDGVLEATGKVGEGEGLVTPEEAYRLARTCALNALAAVASVAGGLDQVARVVKVVGFVASDPSFTGQPAVVNGAWDPLGGRCRGPPARRARRGRARRRARLNRARPAPCRAEGRRRRPVSARGR